MATVAARNVDTSRPAGYGHVLGQFARYVVIGVMNTAINFILVNALSYVTGITSGRRIIPIAVFSFTVAAANSYYFNKHWSFKDDSAGDGGRKFSLFVIVSLIGAGLFAGTVYVVTTFIPPMFGASTQLWLNVGNVCAAAVSLLWNFVGYKLIVFRK